MSYPPPPDQSGQGGYQYDPYGGRQPDSQPPSPQQPGYGPQQPAYGAPQPGYGSQQPGHGQPQMPPPPPMIPPDYNGMQKSNGLAIASMVVGICGAVLFCVPFVNLVLGVLALTFGAVALKKVREGQGSGSGMAITGIVLGIIVCALFVLGIVLRGAFGVFNAGF